MVKPQHIGSSRRGLNEWLLQRLTAVYLAAFTTFVVVRFGLWPITDYSAWRLWVSGGAVRIAVALFFLSALIHTWIGMRSVFLDYLHALWLRVVALILTVTGLVAVGLWAAGLLLEAGVVP